MGPPGSRQSPVLSGAAMAEVAGGVISDWQVHEIAWDIAPRPGHPRVLTTPGWPASSRNRGSRLWLRPRWVRAWSECSPRCLPILPASPGDAQASVLAGIEAGPIAVAAPDPRELSLKAKPVEGCWAARSGTAVSLQRVQSRKQRADRGLELRWCQPPGPLPVLDRRHRCTKNVKRKCQPLRRQWHGLENYERLEGALRSSASGDLVKPG